MEPSSFHRDNRSEHRIRSENLSYDIDVWYQPMKDHTFFSCFVPLSRSEAQAIEAFHDATWRHARVGLLPSHLLALDGLEARIDHALRTEPGIGGKQGAAATIAVDDRE